MEDDLDSGEGTPTVYRLDPNCDQDAVEEGGLYHATVNGVVDYGVFVDVSEHVSGLVHESNLSGRYAIGDDLVVELLEIKDNGDISFAEVDLDGSETVDVAHEYDVARADDLDERVGESIHLEGAVVQIKQTSGPTVFHVTDRTRVVPCAAFENAGIRAYPEVEIDDLVHVTGTVEEHDGSLQVEVESIEILAGEDAEIVADRLDERLDERAQPHEIDPLIDWPTLEQLLPDLAEVAERLRRTVLEGRPIRVRHHADGDGMCAAVPVQVAIERFIQRTHEDPDAPRHLFKRLPSKAPFYEMEDVTRDLNFALEDRARHGQKLPLLLMLDNGSTEEDVPAYENLKHYDVPILVVDHHHPDPEAVEPLVDAHVNPYLHDEDYRVTTGMMCVELARMISPDVTDDLRHVPAVAGLSDRSKADAMADYVDLAGSAGYDESTLQDIGEALDYEAFWLRFDPGHTLINDVLGVDCEDAERHRKLVEFLSARAREDIDQQIEAAMPHVEHEHLDNDAHLFRIDVEDYAHRFTYPAPGTTTGEIHDRKVAETGEPVITIGYGPDFAVLRSDGVRLDIPQMVAELNEEIVGGGVSGGGHLVVGSIKFVKGMREEVLDALVEKMAEAELDENLHSAAVSHEHLED